VFDGEQAVERRTNKALGDSPRTRWQNHAKPQRGDREFGICVASVAHPGLPKLMVLLPWGCYPRLYSMAALRPKTMRSVLRLYDCQTLLLTCHELRRDSSFRRGDKNSVCWSLRRQEDRSSYCEIVIGQVLRCGTNRSPP